MGLGDLCNKYFNTTNLYEIMGIPENAREKDVKKAYYKLSLQCHPDRVKEDDKLEATEKFKVLGSIHALLTDKDKRAVYDETKCLDDDDFDASQVNDWEAYWKLSFKNITEEDIKAYERTYVGSEEEKEDIKKAYLTGKGDMDYVLNHVIFATAEHESRIRDIINEMINSDEVPSYKQFTHEPETKRKRRIAKENREAKEAEEYKKELGLGSGKNSLELMIKQKQQARAGDMDSFLDNLAAKYGNDKPKATKRKAQAKGGRAKRSKK